MIEVTAANSSDIGKALEDAVEAVTKAAAHHGTGIMITQTGAGKYIVRAHPHVPPGLIRQR